MSNRQFPYQPANVAPNLIHTILSFDCASTTIYWIDLSFLLYVGLTIKNITLTDLSNLDHGHLSLKMVISFSNNFYRNRTIFPLRKALKYFPAKSQILWVGGNYAVGTGLLLRRKVFPQLLLPLLQLSTFRLITPVSTRSHTTFSPEIDAN